MKHHFYCQRLTGFDDNEPIEEWNKRYHQGLAMGMSGTELSQFANGYPSHPCKEQCFSCIAIVGERQAKTKQLP